MAVSSGANDDNEDIVDGIISSVYCEAPSPNIYINNVIRLLQLNQAAYLLSHSIKEGISLPVIPEAFWYNTDAIDYTQQWVQVGCTVVADPYGSGGHPPRVDQNRVGIGWPVKDKSGRPDISAEQAAGYLTVFQKILETYVVKRPKELIFGWTTAVAQVDRIEINAIPANGKIITIAGISLTFSSTPTSGQINTSAGTSLEVAKNTVTQINAQITTVKAVLDNDDVLMVSKTPGTPFESTSDADELEISTVVENVKDKPLWHPNITIQNFQLTTHVINQQDAQERTVSKMPYLEMIFDVTLQSNY